MTTYYVDASAGSDSNDGLSEGAPWLTLGKLVSASVLVAGNVINCRGTFRETLTCNGGGTQAAPIILQAWPDSAFVIDGEYTRTAAIATNGQDWITLSGVTVTRHASAGTYEGAIAVQSSTGISVLECTATGNRGTGIRLTGTTAETSCRVYRCVAEGNGGHGIAVAGYYDGTLIDQCTVDNNGLLIGGHGISTSSNLSTVTSGWSGAGPVYTRTFNSFTVRQVIDRSASPWTRLTQNTGTPTTPGSGEWGYSGTTLYINLGGTNPSGRSISIFDNGPPNTLIRDCTISGTKQFGGAEGHGMCLDNLSSGVTVQRCISTFNQGSAYFSNGSQNCSLLACISDRTDGTAITIRGVDVFDGTLNMTLSHCTIGNHSGSGISVGVAGVTCTIKNCITYSNARYGISADASATVTAANNCYYNNTVGARNNVTDATAVAVNPQLRGDYMPLSASLRTAGAVLGGADYYGKEFRGADTIGAVKYQAARSVVARSVVQRSITARSVAAKRVTGAA